MAEHDSLHIIIVGAGIGGLAAAIALRQAGHKVEVFEKSKLANEVGAAVTLQQNCVVVLNRLGLTPEMLNATLATEMVIKDGGTLDTISSIPLTSEALKAEGQCSSYYTHRADLHNALKQHASSQQGQGTPVILHKGCPVNSVDCDTGTVFLSNGEVAVGDVVIGADGIHSKCRSAVVINHYEAVPTGQAIFRFLIPTHEVQSDPSTSGLITSTGALANFAKDGRHIITYPCSGGRMLNCGAFASRDLVGWTKEGFDNHNKKARMLKLFEDFSPSLQRLLEKTEESGITGWDLPDMQTLPLWTKGRVALLGDAAHPFLPYMGQGATQAIEDGVSLAVLLPIGTTRDQIPARLQIYEACRKARADRIQHYSRMRINPVTTNDEIRRYMEYCLNHDEYEHSKRFFESFC